MLGLAFAIVILILAFGSVLAMGLPVGAALVVAVTVVRSVLVPLKAVVMNLLSIGAARVKEEWNRTHDSHRSVADGLAATARVITAAAAIMVFVFGSFLLETDRVIKLFGLGLSVAVLLDATVVRLLLVPATMELLGDRNWWMPRWLDRALPKVDVEGTPDAVPVEAEERVLEPV